MELASRHSSVGQSEVGQAVRGLLPRTWHRAGCPANLLELCEQAGSGSFWTSSGSLADRAAVCFALPSSNLRQRVLRLSHVRPLTSARVCHLGFDACIGLRAFTFVFCFHLGVGSGSLGDNCGTDRGGFCVGCRGCRLNRDVSRFVPVIAVPAPRFALITAKSSTVTRPSWFKSP